MFVNNFHLNNGTKSQLLFLKVDFPIQLRVYLLLTNRYIVVSKCAMHLGHSISSCDRAYIVKIIVK